MDDLAEATLAMGDFVEESICGGSTEAVFQYIGVDYGIYLGRSAATKVGFTPCR